MLKDVAQYPLTAPMAIERSEILQGADTLGYIPIIGSAIGTIRFLASLSVFLAAAGKDYFASGDKDLSDRCSFVVNRAYGEMLRGIGEIFWCTIWLDLFVIHDERLDCASFEGSLEAKDGSSMAYGRWIYTSPEVRWGTCYRQIPINRPITWTVSRVNQDVYLSGAFGSKDPVTLQEEKKEKAEDEAVKKMYASVMSRQDLLEPVDPEVQVQSYPETT